MKGQVHKYGSGAGSARCQQRSQQQHTLSTVEALQAGLLDATTRYAPVDLDVRKRVANVFMASDVSIRRKVHQKDARHESGG